VPDNPDNADIRYFTCVMYIRHVRSVMHVRHVRSVSQFSVTSAAIEPGHLI